MEARRKEWAAMVVPWQQRLKSASLSLLRWRAARREAEVPAITEVMLADDLMRII